MAASKWEKFRKSLKRTREGRSDFKNYLSMVDTLTKKRVSLSGKMALGNPIARSGSVSNPAATKMSTILDKYHDKALRLAQAKYYQKQVG